jgi:crotonobetainyl-CoA:carnitine CoA-transferase CaiB-like acyl-CoA transferase
LRREPIVVREDLNRLLDDAHIFTHGFRPGTLAAQGLSSKELAKRYAHRNIICANMSAYGPSGPWNSNRDFESLIQTCSGMNVSEAEHFGAGKAAHPSPCQALDHAGGYFLAAGSWLPCISMRLRVGAGRLMFRWLRLCSICGRPGSLRGRAGLRRGIIRVRAMCQWSTWR